MRRSEVNNSSGESAFERKLDDALLRRQVEQGTHEYRPMGAAAVAITDTQRGITRATVTNSSGEFLVPHLLPGIYLVRVSAPGFRSVVRENIGLEVAQDIRIDFVLQPGDTQQTVTVSAGSRKNRKTRAG